MNTQQISTTLSPSVKRDIKNKIANIFIENTEGQIDLNIEPLRDELDKILQQLEYRQVINTEKNKKEWQFLNGYSAKTQKLAAEGYLLLFKLRQLFVGDSIGYRLYYMDNNGAIQATVVSEEEQLLNFFKFNNTTIILNLSQVRKSKNKIEEEWAKIINKFFTQYTQPDPNNYMKSPKDITYFGRIVRSNILEKYGSKNKYLTVAGSNKYQVFNRGRIIEGLDNSLSEVVNNDVSTINNEEAVENYFFGKYLIIDHINALKAPDNIITSTSIKFGQADIYDYTTVYNQLYLVKKLLFLQSDRKLKSKKEMKSLIARLFLDEKMFEDNNTSDQISITLDKKVDEITNQIMTQFYSPKI